MHSELERQVDGGWRCEPWEQLVVDASPHDHIVQLYQDHDFLKSAVCRYIGAGLANGDRIILFPTLTHWNAFRQRLETDGVNVQAARERRQLTVVDANEILPRFMRDAMPDPQVFNAVIGDVFRQACAGGSYQKLRAWGELVNVLWERGDVAASMNLEDLFDQLNKKIGIAMFCSYVMDNFNGDVHALMLPRLGTNHTHLIPVEDYVRLERAVAEALRETAGPDEARALESQLLSRYQPPYSMPRSQALLLALRQFLPALADPVLQRSRNLYTAAGAA
jgi:MEDS: MEthanogen/methylotroph, DcmR Sensory domain